MNHEASAARPLLYHPIHAIDLQTMSLSSRFPASCAKRLHMSDCAKEKVVWHDLRLQNVNRSPRSSVTDYCLALLAEHFQARE